MKNKNGLRERDFYKITDDMWEEIEKWSEGHHVDLKFNWEFQPIATFVGIIDQKTGAHIDFCDGKVQKKIDIPKENDPNITNLEFKFSENSSSDSFLEIKCYKENTDYVTELVKNIIKDITKFDFLSEIKEEISKDPKVIKADDHSYEDMFYVNCEDDRLK